MTRFLLKLIPLLAAVFTAFSLVARALGTMQPPHPALAGFAESCTDKPPPCWYGIVPGETNAEDASRIVQQYFVKRSVMEGFPLAFDSAEIDGMTFIGFNYDPTLIVKHIILYFDEKVCLGDILAVIGMPDKVHILDALNKARLVYAYPQGMIGIDTGRGINNLNPRKRGSLYLTLSVESTSTAGGVFAWAGFQREAYYCALDHTLAFCE